VKDVRDVDRLHVPVAVDELKLDLHEFRLYCHIARLQQEGKNTQRQADMAEFLGWGRVGFNGILKRLREKGLAEYVRFRGDNGRIVGILTIVPPKATE
jgi:DNA-binding MarR family transcriptional regulator